MTEQDDTDRRKVTQNIMYMLSDWGLSPKDICSVLDIPGVKVRNIDRFHRGDVFPDDSQVNQRIEHLIGIFEALRLAYPHDERMGKHWLTQRNRRCGNRPPLELLVSDGMNGLINVRAQIDCTFAWKEIDSAF
jgi:hypothetical protein